MSKAIGLISILLAGADQGTTKSRSYAAAVQKATGQELAVQNPDAPAISIPRGTESMVSQVTTEQVFVEMSKGDLEWAPFAINLVEGMLIVGILEGRGGDVELEEVDRVAGTVNIKNVSTWVIRDPRSGVRCSFLTATQLEDKLPPFIGGIVKIFVGPMLESRKGHRYRDFRVGGAKQANGQPRSWARALPAPQVIDVGARAEDAEDLTGGQS